MFQGLHILLEVRHPGLRLQHRCMQRGRGLFQVVIELLVVHQRSHGSLPRIDLGAHRVQMRRSQCCVVDGLLAAIQNAASSFAADPPFQAAARSGWCRHSSPRLARQIQTKWRGTDCPANPRFQIEATESCLMISCVDLVELHDDCHLVAWLVRQHDVGAQFRCEPRPPARLLPQPGPQHCRIAPSVGRWSRNRYSLLPMMKTPAARTASVTTMNAPKPCQSRHKSSLRLLQKFLHEPDVALLKVVKCTLDHHVALIQQGEAAGNRLGAMQIVRHYDGCHLAFPLELENQLVDFRLS